MNRIDSKMIHYGAWCEVMVSHTVPQLIIMDSITFIKKTTRYISGAITVHCVML